RSSSFASRTFGGQGDCTAGIAYPQALRLAPLARCTQGRGAGGEGQIAPERSLVFDGRYCCTDPGERSKGTAMIQIRLAAERGHFNHGWLDTYHTFSFADYYDPANMGFRSLRVMNDDRVGPGAGFGMHGHRDMEIITYVLDGALEHKDSMGNGSVLHYGDVQRMTAGTGVRHSEFNHSRSELVHFLQIWIEPNVQGIAPGYEEKHFTPESKKGQLRLIASPDGRAGSVLIHQDAAIYASI